MEGSKRLTRTERLLLPYARFPPNTKEDVGLHDCSARCSLSTVSCLGVGVTAMNLEIARLESRTPMYCLLHKILHILRREGREQRDGLLLLPFRI